jgi:hypothetical protein
VNYTRLWIDLKAGAPSTTIATTTTTTTTPTTTTSATPTVGNEKKTGDSDFSQIKQFIFAYLQDNNVQTMSQWSANKLTLSVVVLTRHLMALGHFQSDEIKALLRPLTSLLDGRTDVVSSNTNVAKAIAARNPTKTVSAMAEELMNRNNSWEIEDPAAFGYSLPFLLITLFLYSLIPLFPHPHPLIHLLISPVVQHQIEI